MKTFRLISFEKIFIPVPFLNYVVQEGSATEVFEKDTIPTSEGDLEITFIGHATLMFRFKNKIIHVDPVTAEADYTTMPKADMVLITHHHYDHLDMNAIRPITKDDTQFVLTELCVADAKDLKNTHVMKNGDKIVVDGLHIEAIPAYNIKHMRSPGNPFHPKGEGNGYIVTFGDKRVYIAADTENTSEMKALKNIDIAFLPMNLPYTMTPEMVADAAKAFQPKVLYPYHTGETDTSEIIALLKNEKNIEVRIRRMK